MTIPSMSQQRCSVRTIARTLHRTPSTISRELLRNTTGGELRRGYSTRMPRTRGVDRRGQIPDMLSIHVRPPATEGRVMPGYGEDDFIKGAGNKSSVGVLVERSSRSVPLEKMKDATAASALAGISAKLNRLPNSCVTALLTTRTRR